MNKIEKLYDSYDEENRLLRSRECKVESQTTIKYLTPYMKNASVLEVGCGTGYYAFTFRNVFKNYVGVDISSRNIDVFNRAIAQIGSKNISCKIGDGLALDEKNESYDVVLNLGPLYHLDASETDQCIKETIRVCKKGGIMAFAYMNKFGNFVKLCAQENFVGRYPTKELLDNMLTKNTDDDGLFFFTKPEDIEAQLKENDVEILHHLTTDGVVMHHHRIADYRDDEFKLWLEFHYATCEEPSIRGLGDHGLVICRKK